jgi:hypothetical protein
MPSSSNRSKFIHRAFAVDVDGNETPIVADTVLIRLANGEHIEIPLDSFDAGDLLVYGGRMPNENLPVEDMMANTRRLVISPGASNLVALSAIEVEAMPDDEYLDEDEEGLDDDEAEGLDGAHDPL